MSLSFTHFNLHSEFSLQDGIVEISALMECLKTRGMSAVALTDRMNLFAAVKFYRAAKSAKIKPIFGCEIFLRDHADAPDVSAIFLCQNDSGYRNLTQMLSRAYTENQDNRGPWVSYDWLSSYTEGLMVISQEIRDDKLALWAQHFPDRFYLAIQRIGKPNEEALNTEIIARAEQLILPIIATNAVRFLSADDFEAHEARVCIATGCLLDEEQKRVVYTPQQYLRTPDEMAQLFADYPEAIENAIELTQRCNVHLVLGKTHLPVYPVPEIPPNPPLQRGGVLSENDYLSQMSYQGLAERLQLYPNITPEEKKVYDDRLERELAVIHRMGFAGYFLIVADFIQWAKNNGIPVGPGRGSGAGSLIAYVIKITDLDPIVHELLFERFLNPERVSMPDFDIDFCVEGRDRVIEYVAQKYGRANVAQIITYGTMAAKAVIRDVGRVLGQPYGFVDSIAKLIPFEIGMTLDKALEQEEILRKRYEDEEDVKALLDLGKKLEGITRNVGKHAGGVVIAASALTDYTPLYCELGGENRVTQFDKNDVEAVGLVKFDFLGLKTLTIIDRAVKTIDNGLNITHIPIDDKETFDLLKTAQTTALFQLESRGMRELVHRLQLDCFDDIMALVALYRPGPLQSGMVDDFIDRKQGKTPVVYPHPDLEAILKPTYGVILYQEQVMQIAQVLAGYTLGGADILRSAMGKKKVEEMAKQRQIFIDGSVARGVDGELAASIFDLMEKFAGYGFNKSHSAAYALVSYQTAWLKAHYPAEFMAAVLSADKDNTDKVKDFMDECRAMGLKVHLPSLNESAYDFTVNRAGEILYGLGAIKGIGESAVALLIQERQSHGVYTSLFDLCKRVDLRKISRKVLEGLIGAGACDKWDINRGVLMANVDKAIKHAESHHAQQKNGQHDFFALLDATTSEEIAYDAVPVWPTKILLQAEKDKLGFYLTGHPFEVYRQECSSFLSDKIADLSPQKSSLVTIGGLVVDARKIFTKKGKKMAILTLDDGSAKIDIAVFSETFEAAQALCNKDEILIIQGEINLDDYSDSLRMRADSIFSIAQARVRYGKYLLLTLNADVLNDSSLKTCHQILQQYRDGDETLDLKICYHHALSNVMVNPAPEYRARPEDGLLENVHQMCGCLLTVVY